MSTRRPSSLSVTYYDPEAEPVPEPDPAPEPAKPRGRPPGSRNKPKAINTKAKGQIPWFDVWRAVFWAVVAAMSLLALFEGVEGWLGTSAAYGVLGAALPFVAFLLDLDWKKMRSPR